MGGQDRLRGGIRERRLFLSRRDRPVQRATLEQLRVGALVHDAAGVDDDDAVGQVQGRAAVGDEQRRPATHDRAQGRVDGLFHLGVDSTRGVVEQQDPRIAEQGPGEGDPLALSA